jgi:hypothetical protein
VLGIASMFTLAHSITLSLAVLGLVHAPAAVVEPLIAVSIIWVAVENMLGAGRLWRRFAVAFVFGLVHGLGFADALSPLVLNLSRLELSTAEIQQAALALYRNAGYRLVREETVEALSNKTVGSGIRRYYLEKILR